LTVVSMNYTSFINMLDPPFNSDVPAAIEMKLTMAP
jgi:hypothetical protein